MFNMFHQQCFEPEKLLETRDSEGSSIAHLVAASGKNEVIKVKHYANLGEPEQSPLVGLHCARVCMVACLLACWLACLSSCTINFK